MASLPAPCCISSLNFVRPRGDILGDRHVSKGGRSVGSNTNQCWLPVRSTRSEVWGRFPLDLAGKFEKAKALRAVSSRSQTRRCLFSLMSTTDAVQAITDVPNVDTFLAEQEQRFNWLSSWYPVAILGELDRRVPTPLTLLGYPIVLWWDKESQKWRAFKDSCPHRLAPLSEGRIHESGHLQCSYHGWTFRSDGSCSSIPQAPSGSSVHNSPRACISAAYPTLELDGLLWVWPDPSPAGLEASVKVAEREGEGAMPRLEKLVSPEIYGRWAMRDLPYSFETLCENLTDLAHFPFAHHGIQGRTSLRQNARPFEIKPPAVSLHLVQAAFAFGMLEFHPPCLIVFNFSIPGLKNLKRVALFHCVPTSPGRSRLIYSFMDNLVPKFVLYAIPQWVGHVFWGMMIVDSDALLLHVAEGRVKEEIAKSSTESFDMSKIYFFGTPADNFTVGFYTWLKKFGGNRPQWNPKLALLPQPATITEEQLLERQHSHVRYCRSCRDMQRVCERLQILLPTISIAITTALAVAAMRPSSTLSLPPAMAALLVALASLCMGLGLALPRFIRWAFFSIGHYNHALIDPAKGTKA
eukprot:TRINITY_DN14867_c0_g1_i1.p1 TRINITY_DN14867_c0_g1~~TRINITY_DN14867_c0_g1_i1.p1  ORF type:complete len:580 (+),score=100.97 TRINITY_DN14867_c0_g1_i1:82-1821(+)